MYKVMVVEDSRPILRDITRQIQAHDQSVDIMTAYDGESAMRLLHTFQPDILFSDIKLPMIDGLTLIQKAKERYSDLKCVIISGYSDFEFTHEALKLQVDEYILKPVQPADFTRTLSELFQTVKRQRLERQEAALATVIGGGELEYPPNGLPGVYGMVLVQNGIIPRYAPSIKKEDIYTALWTCGESVAWVVGARTDGEKVVLFDNERAVHGLVQQSENLFHELRKRYPQINMVRAELPIKIESLQRQCLLLSNTLSSLTVLGHPSLYTSSSPFSILSLADLNEEVDLFSKKMQGCIRGKLHPVYHAELKERVHTWDRERYPAVFVYRFVSALLSAFQNTGALLRESPHEQAGQMLASCDEYTQLEQRLLECYDTYINAPEQKGEPSDELARRIEKYLRSHIYDCLTNKDLADEFRLSTSYISRLMKSHYRESPMDYYNRLKLEEARRILIGQNVRVKDVADMLGYSDQHYFSKAFKKQYGISPMVLKNTTGEME